MRPKRNPQLLHILQYLADIPFKNRSAQDQGRRWKVRYGTTNVGFGGFEDHVHYGGVVSSQVPG